MTTDLFSLALTAPPGTPLLVERADGHTSTTDLDWWRRLPGARPPSDFPALRWAGAGTALDIGCCTGRHLQFLTSRGIDAHGIDTCPAAVDLARAAGARAELADARTYSPPRLCDTVLALGGGPGIAGTLADVPGFLAHLASRLRRPGGRLIISSVDWTVTAGTDQHRAHVQAARAAGRYPGEVRLRLRLPPDTPGEQGPAGEWFDWVWLDPATLSHAADTAGLAITDLVRFGATWYAASLRRTW
jgi:SAM-dependent methyltransferase